MLSDNEQIRPSHIMLYTGIKLILINIIFLSQSQFTEFVAYTHFVMNLSCLGSFNEICLISSMDPTVADTCHIFFSGIGNAFGIY